MFPAKTQRDSPRKRSSGLRSPLSSQALQWVWNYLKDVPNPHILDCGAVSSATVGVLMRRGAKVYVADLIGPLQRGDPSLWRLVDKRAAFCLDEFLGRFPDIPHESLSLICCWHLLDLVPREELPGLMDRLLSLLVPRGVFYCFLREPNLSSGLESRWWFESLTMLGTDGEGGRGFPYPPVTNREVEKLVPDHGTKTFLTRSHRREVVVSKRGEI